VLPYEGVGRGSEEDLARLRRPLQTRRDVDGIADDERVSSPGISDHDLTGIDADPRLDLLAESLSDLDVQLAERPGHRVGRSHRAERVVLVQAGNAEHGHHGVADELLDLAAVAFELVPHATKEAGDQLPSRFGIELFPQRRGADHVAEHDGHCLAIAFRRGSGPCER
jgi:hypothetical protein